MRQVTEITRLEQLDRLGSQMIGNEPVLIHGSIGHAALMGDYLPPEHKLWGEVRDIDLFAVGTDKMGLESSLSKVYLDIPNPLDAGLCGLLITDGADRYVHKDGVTVHLKDGEVFDEVRIYEVPGTDGIQIKSFDPIGIRAIGCLEPQVIRLGHFRGDQKLKLWFKQNEIELPENLKLSIKEFHRAYKIVYPYGVALHQLADIYTTVVPESIRRQFRSHTHSFMLRHAGRKTPFIKGS